MSQPSLSVFCDFDGTITQQDTVDFLLESLADPVWKDIEDQWLREEITNWECMGRQIPLIHGGWKAIESALHHIKFDPYFKKFAQWCTVQGIPLVIVSEGLDRVIKALLAREKVVVDGIWANHLKESETGGLFLDFPYLPPPEHAPCPASVCKCQIVKNSYPNSFKVVIGDGFNDFCWTKNADKIFAKSKLLTYCRDHKVSHEPFEDFRSIHIEVERLFLEKQIVPSNIQARS